MDYQQLVPEYIRHFQAYVPSKPDEELKKLYGCTCIHRLNNNENPLGPPLAAREIIRHYPPKSAALYPSGDSYYLRSALAGKLGKHPDQFLVGNGSCEVIGAVIKAFCERGDNIITADKTFAVYEWIAAFSGFEPRLVPLKNAGFDADGMISCSDSHSKLYFICNPNNPTGTYWNEAALRQFLGRVGGKSIVVIDEAYCEYVTKPDYPNGMNLLESHPNVLVFRTFSKMYGLAGLRVGYLAGSQELVEIIRRAYVAYSVNGLAQMAACAAIEQGDEHILATRSMLQESRHFLLEALASLKLPVISGEGGYIMIHAPMNDMLLYRKLMKSGMMIRTMTGFRFPNWIRVTIDRKPVMEQFVGILEQTLKQSST